MANQINNYHKCSNEKWSSAQKAELQTWLEIGQNDGDDWNKWWKEHFNNYEFLKNRNIETMIEVGCGPYGKNVKMLLSTLDYNVKKIDLLDPLLNLYIKNQLSIINLITNNTTIFSIPLEEFTEDNKYDLIICINVLDHVYDAQKCIENMYKALKKDGIIIIGQDLTNEIDLQNPELVNDNMHPIKLDHIFFRNNLKQYKQHLYSSILERSQGRNPTAHYGTLLYAGIK